MAFIKDRRFLSHRSVQSIKVPRKTPERLRKTPERPQEDPRKMQRKPSIEMNISIFLHCGLYRGQKVLEPQKFAFTLQWVESEVNRGPGSPREAFKKHFKTPIFEMNISRFLHCEWPLSRIEGPWATGVCSHTPMGWKWGQSRPLESSRQC